MSISITKLINVSIDKRDHQQWPIAGQEGNLDRTEYVTASEVGGCLRMIKFNKLAMQESNYDPAAGTKYMHSENWGFFERGHNVEAWVVEHILRAWDDKKDGELLHVGANQLSYIDQTQSGTPDGGVILTVGGTKGVFTLEIKSVDPRTRFERLPKVVHIDQVIQNNDLAANYYNLPPLGGLLFYVDCSDYKRQVEFPVEFDAARANELMRRADLVMNTDDPADLPAEGMFNDGCKYCKHTRACNQILKTNIGDQTNDQLSKASSKFFG